MKFDNIYLKTMPRKDLEKLVIETFKIVYTSHTRAMEEFAKQEEPSNSWCFIILVVNSIIIKRILPTLKPVNGYSYNEGEVSIEVGEQIEALEKVCIKIIEQAEKEGFLERGFLYE